LKVLSFETEPRLSKFTENGETFTNYLLIRAVTVNDSGKYACAPSNADPASIMVHVVNGEEDEELCVIELNFDASATQSEAQFC
jgi:hypothetical protein